MRPAATKPFDISWGKIRHPFHAYLPATMAQVGIDGQYNSELFCFISALYIVSLLASEFKLHFFFFFSLRLVW